MAIEIRVPSVGESVSEGVLSRWLKPNGSTVAQDEKLFEIETDKATQEIAAPVAGVLRVLVAEGSTVTVGQIVGAIDTAASPSAPAPTPPLPSPAAATKSETALSPAARRVVTEHGLDASQITGTGRGGRITKEDALAATVQATSVAVAPPTTAPVAPPTPVPTPPPPSVVTARETRQRMTGVRQRIAARLLESQSTTASLTTFNEADMSAIMGLREKYKDRFKEKHGVGLGFMSFFVKGVVEALKAFPMVNSRIDGSDIVTAHYYDIGVAVSTEKGLFVPILRDADKQSFAAIEKAIVNLAGKARENKITPEDLRGGTFTITNGGVFGSMMSTPILNPPQSAILGMHAIQRRPVAVSEQVVIRPMMYLALTYDHRLIDGREAVQFLVRVKECVENPERLLLDV